MVNPWPNLSEGIQVVTTEKYFWPLSKNKLQFYTEIIVAVLVVHTVYIKYLQCIQYFNGFAFIISAGIML